MPSCNKDDDTTPPRLQPASIPCWLLTATSMPSRPRRRASLHLPQPTTPLLAGPLVLSLRPRPLNATAQPPTPAQPPLARARGEAAAPPPARARSARSPGPRERASPTPNNASRRRPAGPTLRDGKRDDETIVSPKQSSQRSTTPEFMFIEDDLNATPVFTRRGSLRTFLTPSLSCGARAQARIRRSPPARRQLQRVVRK